MKISAILISVVALVAFSTSAAHAQDDDDLFGDGDGTGDGIVDDGTGTGDGTATDGTGDPAPANDAAANGEHNLGVGFSTPVGGLSSFGSGGGAEVEFWIGDKLAINGLGRLFFFSPDVDMADSILGLQIGGGILFALKQTGPAMLMVGARALLGFTSGDAGTTSFAIELPLRLQMRVAPRLSVHAEGGAAIGIGDQSALGGGDQSFSLFIGTQNLFGQAGLTAYF